MKNNTEFRTEARRALRGRWLLAAAMTLIYFLIAGAANGYRFFDMSIGMKYSILLPGVFLFPIMYGYEVAFLSLKRKGNLHIGQLFDGFRDYGRVLGTLLLTIIYTTLWTLLLIIPGFIKAYSYGMTNYILKDRPELKFNGAIEESMRMMHGHKMKLFLLHLSFIGWFILSIFTLGLGLLFLCPYMYSSQAAFYEDLKANDCNQVAE